ncbi:MAG: putative response-associated peptidase [Rhodoglobus sp.]|nr:putative response-associated peptidase [Rhodoglobus sp.]
MTPVAATIACMCGRFVVAGAASDLVTLFDVDLPADDLPAPSWNIAPTDRVPIVIDTIPKGSDPDSEPVRRLEAARWGLVPPWAKDASGGVKAFNARIESVGQNAQFKNALKKRRAIVPATGYYEWKTVDGVKTPQFIHLPDDELLVFAGLYEWWRNPAAADDSPDKWLLSTSILTRDATGELAGIHDRMPVLLDPSLVDEWLDPGAEGSEELLEEVSAGGAELANNVEFYEVDRAVGNVKNNSPELMRPV